MKAGFELLQYQIDILAVACAARGTEVVLKIGDKPLNRNKIASGEVPARLVFGVRDELLVMVAHFRIGFDKM
jgi:hypothetical protein